VLPRSPQNRVVGGGPYHLRDQPRHPYQVVSGSSPRASGEHAERNLKVTLASVHAPRPRGWTAVPCSPLPSFLQSSELRRYPQPNSRQTGAVRDVGNLPPLACTSPGPGHLAPDITRAILDGRHPRDLTAQKQLARSRLPLAWPDQRRLLGFT
jgi:hypothetical protein